MLRWQYAIAFWLYHNRYPPSLLLTVGATAQWAALVVSELVTEGVIIQASVLAAKEAESARPRASPKPASEA